MSTIAAATPDIDPVQFLKIAGQGAQLRSHADLWRWLQGDVQRWLPHDILLVGWGDFRAGDLQYDIVSSLPGLRTHLCPASRIAPLVNYFRDCWAAALSQPCQLDISGCGQLLGEAGQGWAPAPGTPGMQTALVHGVGDTRLGGERIFAALSCDLAPAGGAAALKLLVPFIDSALRRMPPRADAPARRRAHPGRADGGAPGPAVRARAPDHGVGRHGQDQPRDRLHPAHQRVHGEEPHEEHLQQAGRDATAPRPWPSSPGWPLMPEAERVLGAATAASAGSARLRPRRAALPGPAVFSHSRLLRAFETFVEPLATVLSLWLLVWMVEGELTPRWLMAVDRRVRAGLSRAARSCARRPAAWSSSTVLAWAWTCRPAAGHGASPPVTWTTSRATWW